MTSFAIVRRMQTIPSGVPIAGDLVREKRQLAGLTVRGLAELAGMSAPYLSQIETGAKATVGQPMFVKICDALGVAEKDRRTLIKAVAA